MERLDLRVPAFFVFPFGRPHARRDSATVAFGSASESAERPSGDRDRRLNLKFGKRDAPQSYRALIADHNNPEAIFVRIACVRRLFLAHIPHMIA